MREVIQQVVATEAEAKRMVQSAMAEAGGILSEARRQALELMAAVRAAAQREAQDILSKAATHAEQDKQARLAKAVSEIEHQVCLDERVRQEAVAAVVRCICG